MGNSFSACFGSENELSSDPKYRKINKTLIGNPTNFEHRSHFGNENLSSNDYKADEAKIKMATLSRAFDPSLIDNPTSLIQKAILIEQAQAQLFSRLQEFKKEAVKAKQTDESTHSPTIKHPISQVPPTLPPLDTQESISEFSIMGTDLDQNIALPSIEDAQLFTQSLSQNNSTQASESKSFATDTLMPLEAEPDETVLYQDSDPQSVDIFDTVLSDISPDTPNQISTNESQTSKPLPLPPKSN